MTTNICQIELDQLSLSQYRPDGLPVPDTGLLDLVARSGIECLPMITARSLAAGQYEVVAGVLTCRVAQFLSIQSLKIQLVDLDEQDVIELVKQDFNLADQQDALKKPVQTGWYIRHQSDNQRIKPTEVGRKLGLNRRDTSLCVRLTRLDDQVQRWVKEGRLTVALARRLVTLTQTQQKILAAKVIQNKWTVRQLEQQLKLLKQSSAGARFDLSRSNDKSDLGVVLPGEHYQRITDEEKYLSEQLGTEIEVHYADKGDGFILIHYHGLDEYTGIAERLRQQPQLINNMDEFHI